MRVAFFGTPEFAVPTLKAILESNHELVFAVAQPDRPSGRGMKLHRPPVAQVAIDHGVPLEQPERIDQELIGRLKSMEVAIGVVVAYGRILPKRLIESVPHGFINVHASLLPSWRGAAPVQRSIEAGEQQTGVTIMRIDEKLDHGPLFASRKVDVGPDDLAPHVFERLARAGGPLLVEVLDAIEAGVAIETEQEHSKATHARKLDKEEGRIDWTLPAKVIYDRYRAFYPWPGVYFTTRGELIRLTSVSGIEAEEGEPGQVLRQQGPTVVVATGEGAIRIEELQRPGRRSSDAGGVLRGIRVEAGDRLE